MKYNLLENTYLTVNSGTSSVSLTNSQLVSLVDGSLSKNLYGDGGDVLALDADLSARVKIDEIRYYFSSDFNRNSVASGIVFYHKNESFESFLPLYTELGSTYYYATVSGVSAPRYVRVVHTLDGTSVSGILTEFSILNNDDYVDFGTDGTKISESTHTARNETDITTIPIYNDSDVIADAYVSIEPQGTFIDDLLYISSSESGPWVGVRGTSEEIAAAGTFDGGTYNNVVENSSDYLEIATGSGIGLYTTKIFKDDDYKYSRLNIDTITPTNTIVSNGVGAPLFYAFNGGLAWDDTTRTNTYINARIVFDSSVLSSMVGKDIVGIRVKFNSMYEEYQVDSCYVGTKGAGNYDFAGDQVKASINGSLTANNWIFCDDRYTGYTDFNFDASNSFVVAVHFNYAGNTYPHTTKPTGVITYFNTDSSDKSGDTSPGGTWNEATTHFFIEEIEFLNKTVSEINDNDAVESIEIRSSTTAPIKYLVYRKLYYQLIVDENSGNKYGNYFKDYTIPNEIEVYDSKNGDFEKAPIYYATEQVVVRDQLIVLDKNTNNLAGFLFRGSYILTLFYYKYDEGVMNNVTVFSDSSPDSDTNLIYIKIWEYGVWGYYFEGSDEYYHLIHYDTTLTIIYDYYQSSDFVYSMDVDYETGKLWYTNNTSDTLTKIDIDGTVEVTYIYGSEDPRGVCSDGDDGCWFINGYDVHHVDSDGELVTTLSDVGTTGSTLKFIEKDTDGGFWVLDSYSIVYLTSSGRALFTVYVPYADSFRAVDSGVMVNCTDGYQRFVDKGSRSITLEINSTEKYLPIEYDYSDAKYTNRFPLSYDTYWNNLDWYEVRPSAYELPEDSYNQVRISLRGIDDTPVLKGIYVNRNVEIENIYPGQYKNVYLKVQVPDQDLTVGNYNSNLRVWWNKPV